MRGWPLPRPTHAPATTLKTNGNSAPIKPVSFPSSKRVKESPQTKNPSCRHSVAACVSDHSRGQYMLPQRPQSNRKRIPPPSSFRNLRRKAGMTPHWRECEAPLRRTQRDGADETILCRSQAPLRIPAPATAPGTNTAPAARRACLPIGIPGGFFHTLSCGGMRGWPLPRPTHAPATTLKTNGNSAPIKPVSFPSSKRVKESPQTKNPSCRHSVAACVSDHSRGQYMLPQRPQSNRKRIPPPSSFRNLRRKAGLPSHWSSGGILSHHLQRRFGQFCGIMPSAFPRFLQR